MIGYELDIPILKNQDVQFCDEKTFEEVIELLCTSTTLVLVTIQMPIRYVNSFKAGAGNYQ